MKTSQFDTVTNSIFTTEIEYNGTIGNEYGGRITGKGYFVIVNPDSEYVSFSKNKHNICFGDIVSDIIPDYTNQQYANDYGDRLLGNKQTVREYMQQNCGMDII